MKMQNREIKFRVWDKLQKKMFLPDGDFCGGENEMGYAELYQGLKCEHGDIPSEDQKELVFQQFTGLVDCAGTEIYEGDFVTLRTVAHDYHTTVVFEGGCFAFKVINPQGTLSLVFAHLIDSGHFEAEVFGNRFEGDQPDPEVLGKYSPK